MHAILVEDVPHTLDTFWLGFHMNESDGGGTLYPLGFILWPITMINESCFAGEGDPKPDEHLSVLGNFANQTVYIYVRCM